MGIDPRGEASVDVLNLNLKDIIMTKVTSYFESNKDFYINKMAESSNLVEGTLWSVGFLFNEIGSSKMLIDLILIPVPTSITAYSNSFIKVKIGADGKLKIDGNWGAIAGNYVSSLTTKEVGLTGLFKKMDMRRTEGRALKAYNAKTAAQGLGFALGFYSWSKKYASEIEDIIYYYIKEE
jgi:hypothetical protein